MRSQKNTLKFYRNKLPYKNRDFNTKLLTLPEYFRDMIGDKKEVNIAELGAAMFCTIGSLWEGVKVNMYASDILSDEFNAILKEHNITPLVPVTKEDMEDLSYEDNFFDIVHCANALDHTENPFRALQEMKRVCKEGGYIYLKHVENVGEHEGYQGSHKWNIQKIDNDVKIWSKTESFILSDYFNNFEVHYETERGLDSIVVIKIKR